MAHRVRPAPWAASSAFAPRIAGRRSLARIEEGRPRRALYLLLAPLRCEPPAASKSTIPSLESSRRELTALLDSMQEGVNRRLPHRPSSVFGPERLHRPPNPAPHSRRARALVQTNPRSRVLVCCRHGPSRTAHYLPRPLQTKPKKNRVVPGLVFPKVPPPANGRRPAALSAFLSERSPKSSARKPPRRDFRLPQNVSPSLRTKPLTFHSPA